MCIRDRFLLIPIYWLVNMSLKTNNEIISTFSLIPNDPVSYTHLDVYKRQIPARACGWCAALIS